MHKRCDNERVQLGQWRLLWKIWRQPPVLVFTGLEDAGGLSEIQKLDQWFIAVVECMRSAVMGYKRCQVRLFAKIEN